MLKPPINALLTVVATLALFVVLSEANAGNENRRFYNQCSVQTNSDAANGRKSHSIFCQDVESKQLRRVVGSITFACNKNNDLVSIKKGLQWVIDDTVIVSYRYDKKPTVTVPWEWHKSSKSALSRNTQLHDKMLSLLASSRRLAVEVHQGTMDFNLTGSARAVSDYRKRCAAL